MVRRIIVTLCALCVMAASFTKSVTAQTQDQEAAQPLNTTLETAYEFQSIKLYDDVFTKEDNVRYYKFAVEKMTHFDFNVNSDAKGEVRILDSRGRKKVGWPLRGKSWGFTYPNDDPSLGLLWDDGDAECIAEEETLEPGSYYIKVTADKGQFSKKRQEIRFHAMGNVKPLEPYLKLKKTSAVYTGKKIKRPRVKVIGEGATFTIGNKKYVIKYNQVYDMRTDKRVKFIKDIGRYRICNDSFNLDHKSVGPGESCAVFTVTPQKGVLKAVKSKKRGQLQIAAKKHTAAGRYQIQVSADKQFQTDVQNYRTKKTDQTVKHLESGTKYYVRVRYYKNVSVKYNHGQSAPEPIYGEWSKTKAVVCK